MSSTQFLVGGTLGAGLRLRDSLIVSLIGCCILTLYASFLGHIAQRTGSSFAQLVAGPFGTHLGRLPAALFAFLETGWLAVALGIASATFAGILPLPESVWTVIFALAFTSTALLGIRHMSVFSVPTVPIMGFLVILVLVRALGPSPHSPFAFIPTQSLPLHTGLDMAVGSFILSTTTSPDILRFARSTRDAVLASICGFLIGNFLFLAGGAVAAAAYGTWDVAQILIRSGLAIPGVFLMLANIWTSFDTGIYTAGLEMGVVTRWSRLGWTIILAMISCCLALAGIYHKIVEWLTFLSIVIPPIGGIIIAYYFLIRCGPSAANYKPAGLVSWLIACCVSLWLYSHGYLMGIGGALVGFLAYLASAGLSRLRTRSKRISAISSSTTDG